MKHPISIVRQSVVYAFALAILAGPFQAYAGPLASVPLNLVGGKANVLIILDNSNSMDENALGEAVASNAATSKSEIARGVVRNLVAAYQGQINLGLMAYRQDPISSQFIYNSPYDVSYNPANYNPLFTGARDSATKRFRTPNPTSSGDWIHYNVALPFYSGTNQGNGFCYSPTAIAFNNGENPTTGPWDTYRCFGSKTGTSDSLPAWRSNGDEKAKGYTGFLFESLFYPTDSDLAQGILDFGRFNTYNIVGQSWFNNTSPGRGFLHTPIKALDATQASTLLSKLKCSVPGQPGACNNSGIPNAGLTPIEGTLLTAKDYFGGAWNVGAEGYVSNCYPLPQSCGKNFVILLTDGLPSNDKNGNAVTIPATALAAAATAAASLNTAGVETYVIGFALPYGTNPASLDSLASSGGTGAAYAANDTASLTTAFNKIFNDIIAKTGSSSSVATNSTSLNTNTKVFQARFSSQDWSGQLLSLTVNPDGSVNSVPNWDAGTVLTNATTSPPNSRAITTFNPDTSVQGGLPFRWASLSAAMKTDLNVVAPAAPDARGSDRLDWIRGVRTSEGVSNATFRSRTNLMGSVINSNPRYVGTPASGYPGAAYATFKSAYASRTEMIYLGGSDGMLHGFAATDGKEKFAFIPSKVFGNLSRLTSQTYTHKYMVDGSPTVADAYVNTAWRTMLVGGLGAGGQGMYALDVTDPSNLTEANAGSVVMGEFTDLNDAELGYVLGEPKIVKMNNDKWAVIFGNGLNNSEADGAVGSGKASIFILMLDRTAGSKTWTLNTHYYRIDTGSGSSSTPNGVTSVVAVDTDRDGKTDYIYGGDLLGNVWKVDVTSATPGSWALANSGNPIFIAKDSIGTRQPISGGGIEVTKNPNGGMNVMFGSGKYIESTDLTDTQLQSFYSIWDNGITSTVVRANLQAQTIIAEQTAGGSSYRQTSTSTVDHTTQKGWYMDLKVSGGSNLGERVVYRPVLRGGRVIFVTLTPVVGSCAGGGYSWLMELDAINGSRLSLSPFDSNGDGLFNTSDMVTFTGPGTTTYASGQKASIGIVPQPTVIREPTATDREYKVLSGSSGATQSVRESTDERNGRLTWRDIAK